MELMIIFCLGWWLGSWFGQLLQRRAFWEILRDLKISEQDLHRLRSRVDDDEPTEDRLTEVEITLEQHGEQIYAFRKDNDQFLGQGDSAEALIRRLARDHQNTRLICAQADGGRLLGQGRWQWDHKEHTAKKID